MKNEHPNKDIILLKIRELRREGIPQSAWTLLDSIEDLVVNTPKHLLIPDNAPDDREQAQYR
jgi:hypothetical protein